MGVFFDSYKRDGSVDWRLQFRDNLCAVNCLTYTRWVDIGERTISLLRRAAAVLQMSDNPIRAVQLQYIDRFNADAGANYDLSQLLRKDSELLPPALWERGALWHVHEGWFTTSDLPLGASRVLEVVNLSGLQEGSGSYFVQIDALHKAEFPSGREFVDAMSEGLVDQTFENLHQKNKALVLSLLQESVAAQISLTPTRAIKGPKK